MSGDYNFNLSSEQEQRAQQLHTDAISIDMCSMGPGGPALYDRLPEDVVEERLPQSMHPIQRFIVGMELPYYHLPITPETKPAQEAQILEVITDLDADLLVLAR